MIKVRKVDNDPGNDMISYPPDLYEHPRKDFTCYGCPDEWYCSSAYYWYNTNGDCLENK